MMAALLTERGTGYMTLSLPPFAKWPDAIIYKKHVYIHTTAKVGVYKPADTYIVPEE